MTREERVPLSMQEPAKNRRPPAVLFQEQSLVTKLLRDSEPRMGWQAGRTSSGIIHYTERKYVCRVRRESLSNH